MMDDVASFGSVCLLQHADRPSSTPSWPRQPIVLLQLVVLLQAGSACAVEAPHLLQSIISSSQGRGRVQCKMTKNIYISTN